MFNAPGVKQRRVGVHEETRLYAIWVLRCCGRRLRTQAQRVVTSIL